MPLRVVSGEARGRPLRAPKHEKTRPTTDRIKGVIFSMLEAEAYKRGLEPEDDGRMATGLAWPRVLDLFAGSGALGIEALSRGADHATFVESDREAVDTINANLRSLDLADRAEVVRSGVEHAFARLRGPFDLVLVDPPYAEAGVLNQALQGLAAPGLLHEGSAVVVEQASEARPPDALGPLRLRTVRAHGRTAIALYLSPGAAPAPPPPPGTSG